MLICALLLSILGIVVLYSSSPLQAIQQALYCLVGILLYLFLYNLDYRVLKPVVKPVYVIIFWLLVIVFVIGFESRGSVRWIPLGIINLQPSELAKPVMIVCLAYFWAESKTTWKNILKSLMIFLPFFLLIFRQPDLGTALTLAFIWLVMLLCADISLIKVFFLTVSSVALTPLGWLALQEYQKQRIISFIFPTQDPLGKGFHVIQSMIAVGSGGLFGRGLGRGTQSRLQFLPEFRTDFIFAFIAEELGFMGSLIVLSLYSMVLFFCFRIFDRASDRLGQLISVGVMGMLFFQVLVNIGMNSGIMPVTGITLPMLSYGGSSMLATFLSLGLIGSVGRFGLRKNKVLKFDLV